MALNHKQKRFCEEYVIDPDAYRASFRFENASREFSAEQLEEMCCPDGFGYEWED